MKLYLTNELVASKDEDQYVLPKSLGFEGFSSILKFWFIKQRYTPTKSF